MQVHIHIKSEQQRKEFAETPVTQVQTARGELVETENGFTLSYPEPDASVGGTATLAWNGKRLVLTRENGRRTVMIFSEGMTTSCAYQTMFGEINMNIHTEKITVLKRKNGYTVHFKYTLVGEGLDIMQICFSLLVKPHNGGAHG